MEKFSDIQFKTPAEIKRYQELRLADELEYLNRRSAFYQRMFREERIDISCIRTLEDLQQLPVTTKQTCNCIMKILFVWIKLRLSIM